VLGIGGKQAEAALDKAGITVNKNMIPYDERKPMDPSGVRLGTPALTTRGMGSGEMRSIARWIIDAIKGASDEAALAKIRRDGMGLCKEFPGPGGGVACLALSFSVGGFWGESLSNAWPVRLRIRDRQVGSMHVRRPDSLAPRRRPRRRAHIH